MKTQDAIKMAGTAKKLADFLNITSSAISQWGEDVPEGRFWQLKAIKPEWHLTPAMLNTEEAEHAGKGAS